MINKIVNLTFSPTGNCARIGTTVSNSLCSYLKLPVITYDITLPQNRTALRCFSENDLLVITMPVYAGRLPNKLLPDLTALLKGNGTPAIPMVSYGNRNFDDALSELCLLLSDSGFLPIAAAAVPSEHAFTHDIAGDRPNTDDLTALKAFGSKVGEMILQNKDQFDTWCRAHRERLTIPGNNPPGPYYTPLGTDGQPARFLKAKPKTDEDRCIRCGKCAAHCPMGSIDRTNICDVPGICIKCQACIHVCPTRAKYFDDEAFLSHVDMLRTFAVGRKEIAFFMGEEKGE